MNVLLKPCRFCKNEDIKVEGYGFRAFIKCYKCGFMRGGFSSNKTLISVWNKENAANE